MKGLDLWKDLAQILPGGVYRRPRLREPRAFDPRSPKIERAKLKRERRQCKRLIEVKAGGWKKIGHAWERMR